MQTKNAHDLDMTQTCMPRIRCPNVNVGALMNVLNFSFTTEKQFTEIFQCSRFLQWFCFELFESNGFLCTCMKSGFSQQSTFLRVFPCHPVSECPGCGFWGCRIGTIHSVAGWRKRPLNKVFTGRPHSSMLCTCPVLAIAMVCVHLSLSDTLLLNQYNTN